jgi:hypothetical protein
VVNPLITSHDCNKSNISNPKVIQSLLISEAGASEEKYHWLSAVIEQKRAKPKVKHLEVPHVCSTNKTVDLRKELMVQMALASARCDRNWIPIHLGGLWQQ